MDIYVVKQGDSVDSIATQFGVPVESVVYNNQLEAPYRLAIGQALLIPSDDVDSQKRQIWSGGYAYPYIQRDVLLETLPYLSGIYLFSYGFSTDGMLLPPAADDTFLIESALENGVRPILTLTPFGEDGSFNNFLIHQIVNNEESARTLIENLTETVQQKGFQGVDIDFEYIMPADRQAYVAFVENVRQAIHAIGYEVSVALAPKTSDEQQGLLYEGKDYEGLGRVSDSVLLMTYEWGYTYGPPMAVAPINEVRRVVEYALTRIPAEKINLGIPNYGYDWTLPYVRGESVATAVSLRRAVEIAIENDAVIQYDPVSMSPYFGYEKDGVIHEVWFEDVRSLREKFSLVTEYDLRGVVYWQIMRFFRPNWILLSDTFLLSRE